MKKLLVVLGIIAAFALFFYCISWISNDVEQSIDRRISTFKESAFAQDSLTKENDSLIKKNIELNADIKKLSEHNKKDSITIDSLKSVIHYIFYSGEYVRMDYD